MMPRYKLGDTVFYNNKHGGLVSLVIDVIVQDKVNENIIYYGSRILSSKVGDRGEHIYSSFELTSISYTILEIASDISDQTLCNWILETSIRFHEEGDELYLILNDIRKEIGI